MPQTARQSAYLKKLRDPRWQKKRLEVMERDEFVCQFCYDDESTLHVHHLAYESSDPWETDSNLLVTLCEGCHEKETEEWRPAAKRLIDALHKAKFSASDVNDLTTVIQRGFTLGWPWVLLSALEYWVADPVRRATLTDGYFDALRRKVWPKRQG